MIFHISNKFFGKCSDSPRASCAITLSYLFLWSNSFFFLPSHDGCCQWQHSIHIWLLLLKPTRNNALMSWVMNHSAKHKFKTPIWIMLGKSHPVANPMHLYMSSKPLLLTMVHEVTWLHPLYDTLPSQESWLIICPWWFFSASKDTFKASFFVHPAPPTRPTMDWE